MGKITKVFYKEIDPSVCSPKSAARYHYHFNLLRLHESFQKEYEELQQYATQLGFGGTTNRIYMRNAYNTSTFGDWQALAYTSDIPTVSNSNGYVPRFVSFPSYSHFGSSTNTYDYLQNIVKWIYDNANYGDRTYLMGVGNPNSLGMMNIQLYGTSGKNSEGWPRYCSGTFLNLGDSAFEIFGTNNYNYYRYRLSVDGHGHRITKLHRRDSGDDYSLQHHWTGSYWYLRGYSGDTFHAEVQVGYANSAGNADTVDGYHVATAGNNKPWSKIVSIGSDGVSEMGRYIDFHYDNTTGSDFSIRLQVQGNYSNQVYLPTSSGTLALTSQIPSSLPANGGNADTVDNCHASDFLQRLPWWTSGNGNNIDTVYNGTTFAYTNHKAPTNGVFVAFSGTHNSYQLQLQGQYNGENLYFRNKNGDNGTWNAWRSVIHSGNIGSQTVSNSYYLLPSSGSYGHKLQYYSGQSSISGNFYDGSSNNASLYSFPTGCADSTGTIANVQVLRLGWSSAYWHDFFVNPNRDGIWHRSVRNGTAGSWRQLAFTNGYHIAVQSSAGTDSSTIYFVI